MLRKISKLTQNIRDNNDKIFIIKAKANSHIYLH